jgi:hypothetical protein
MLSSEPLTSVKSTVSPSVTTIGGDAPVPRWYLPLTAKLHTSVGASSLETWVTCWKTSTLNFFTTPGGGGGSVGSTAVNFSKLDALGVGKGRGAAGAAAAAGAAVGAGVGAAATGRAALSSPAVANAKAAARVARRATRAQSASPSIIHSRLSVSRLALGARRGRGVSGGSVGGASCSGGKVMAISSFLCVRSGLLL